MTETRGTGPTLGALVLFIVAVLLVVAGTGYDFWQGQRQAAQLNAEIRAQQRQAVVLAAEIRTLCAEHSDVGTAPVPVKASELGVKLITDFRAAYAGLGVYSGASAASGCPGAHGGRVRDHREALMALSPAPVPVITLSPSNPAPSCTCPPCWGGLCPPPACPVHGRAEMIQVRC